ncbi:MAG: MFS transporter [Calothrix sp. FI2-JRJ7]|jgi:MFS family permease|nr:MFS transporter [Calothrix sp. FI2-JRJ7]
MSKTNSNSNFTKATLLLVSTLTVMSGATISPSLPAMREYFSNVQNADYLVKLSLTLPALFIALGAPLAGIIIDRVGRKPLLIIALIIYGIAGSSGLILNDLTLILVGRALLGISVAGIMTTATTLIADYYIGVARAHFLGLQAAFMGLGGVFFLSIGGFIAEANWRYPFGIYLFSLLLVPCALTFLLEPERNQPVNQNHEIVTQAQKLPFNLVIITYGIGILTQIVFYLIPVQLPFYLKQLFGAGASQSGIAIALATLFSAMASLLYRQIKTKFSFTAIYGIAFLNIGIGYYFISIGKAYPMILLGLAIAGSGLGLLMPNMNFCLISVTPDTMRGKILSGVTTSLFLGQFISPLLSQPLSAKVGLANTYASAGGFMFVLAVIALITLYNLKGKVGDQR